MKGTNFGEWRWVLLEQKGFGHIDRDEVAAVTQVDFSFELLAARSTDENVPVEYRSRLELQVL